MLRRNHTTRLGCLLAVLLSSAAAETAQARDAWPDEVTLVSQADRLRSSIFTSCELDPTEVTADMPYTTSLTAWNLDSDAQHPDTDLLPAIEAWDANRDEAPAIDPDVFSTESFAAAGAPYEGDHGSDAWFWKVMPAGILYHSYMASVHEPRMAFVSFYELEKGRTLWDPTLGGRVGVLRFGNCDPLHPQGWQLDMEGAVMVRLDVENRQDLDGSDYRFGFPFTYAIDNWQFKFGYYHISSHLGDERMLREPALSERINYVRDGFLYGVSFYPVPSCRLYGEVGGAFHFDGGAKPIELQFGTELAPPGPTNQGAVPFFAINGHLRQDHHFGGDVSLQTGWLWRGDFGQTMRTGAHYFNGKSSQYQFYDTFEQQLGIGVWYDY